MSKKHIAMVLVLSLLLGILSGCTGRQNGKNEIDEDPAANDSYRIRAAVLCWG